jgi:VanZ family protein
VSSQKTAGVFALTAAVALIVASTLTPDPTDPWTHHFWCWRCSKDATFIEFGLNVALFIPFGASMRAVGVRFWRAMAVVIVATVAIEALQYFVVPGRDASIADCVANAIGGIAGFALLAPLGVMANPSPRAARRIAIGAGVAWTVHAALAMYLFQPAGTRKRLLVQVAPQLAQYDVFTGPTRDATLNGAMVFDGALPRGFTAQTLVGQPLELSIALRPDSATRRFAPILALVDGMATEIASLGQRRTDLVFYTYMRANAHGFWSPKVVMPGVFVDTSALIIVGRRDGNALTVSVRSASAAPRDEPLALRPAVSWWLWWPFTIPAAWTITMITWLWVATAFVLLGYWSARGWWASKVYLSERLWAFVPIIVAAGVAHVAVPLAFRATSLGGALDVTAIAIGAVAGLALGGLRKSGSGP